MDRQTLKNFRADFAEAVKDLSKQYNFDIRLGNISYSDNQFTSKLTVTAIGDADNGEEARWKESLRRYGHRYGLTEDDYDRVIMSYDGQYRLRGIKPRARKYPIVAEKNGTRYKLSDSILTNLEPA